MSSRHNNKARRRNGLQTQGGSGQTVPVRAGTTLDYSGDNQILKAALDYAALGLAVFPVKHPDVPGQEHPGKEPLTAHGFNDATTDPAQIAQWWQKWPTANIGIATGEKSGGLLALDLDAHEGGADGLDTLHDWERKHGELPDTARALTGGGGVHLLYFTTERFKSVVCEKLAVDIRDNGACIIAAPSAHASGRRYEWEQDPDETPIAQADANVLAFARYIEKTVEAEKAKGNDGNDKDGGDGFKLPDTLKEGSRNTTLADYGFSLRGQGANNASILAALKDANAARCKPPLPAGEVERIAASVCKKDPGPNGGKGKEPQHIEVCRALIDKRGAVMVDGVPVLAADKPLCCGWDAMERAAYAEFPNIKTQTWREARHCLLVTAPVEQAAPDNYVAFLNGVLDINTMEFYEECPQGVVPVVIPHEWDPDAPRAAVVDTVLDGFADGYPATRANLEEVLGECITRGGGHRHIFFFQGAGGNGKSTFFSLVEWIVGADNCQAMDPHGIGEKFQSTELQGALVNIADDIGSARIGDRDCAVLKSASLGGFMDGQIKGEQRHVKFHPYATFLFACNDQPLLADTSEGMQRRVYIIPATASFKGSEGRTAAMLAAIRTEGAAQYALRLAVEARRRVLDLDGMTHNDRALFLRDELMRDSDPLLAYIEEAGLTRDGIVGDATKAHYDDYEHWREDAGYGENGKMERREFTRRMCAKFNLRSVKKRFGVGQREPAFAYPQG